MPPDGLHGRRGASQIKNSRVLSMMDKYRQKAARLSLPQLLLAYQTSFGLHTSVIHEEILRRRSDGSLYKERGTPKNGHGPQLSPHMIKAVNTISAFCEAHKFTRADNATGGGISIRKVMPSISLDAVMLRLVDDVKTFPSGVVVYYRMEADSSGYGVVLHYDYDDFVVMFD